MTASDGTYVAVGEQVSDPSQAGPLDEADRWRAGLPYPQPVLDRLPGLHAAFNAINRFVGVPALRLGLGGAISSPVSGYLALLRTHGRSSGLLREAPLGYCIYEDAVYVLAGFGRQTHWFRNLQADPQVEIVLPGRAFSGVADEVTDPAERASVLPRLLRSMGLVVLAVGMGNPYRDPPQAIAHRAEGLPLVRIRATGVAAGPNDPGGQGWLLWQAGGLVLLGLLIRARRRGRQCACGEAARPR